MALWQTERVRSLLAAAGYSTERVEIKTTGDLTPDVPLSSIGSRALFTKQIDDALLAGRVDLAVHSRTCRPGFLKVSAWVLSASGKTPGMRWSLALSSSGSPYPKGL